MTTRPATSSASAMALWILAGVAVVFFLRTAKSLLIPLALAVLISYALEPLVNWLERHRLPRLVGTAVVMLAILAGGAAGAYGLREDVQQVVKQVPQAAERAREMVRSQLGSSNAATDPVGTTGEETTGQTGPLLQRAVGSMFETAGNIVVIFFLVCFLLYSGHHFRDRFVEVVGRDAVARRTIATIVNEINGQIQRYLLVLLVTGTVVGVATWLVLAWIGVQNAAMWGILAGVFNSIPYFGPVIVSGGLFVVGLVQGGGSTQAIQMAGASIVITSLEGWLLTPPLMGKAERMNALVVFGGLMLWTWVWGGWGTVLAVPMLVIIKSVADHVDTLKPVGRLMAP